MEGKRDSSGVGSCPKSLKTLIDLPETIQLYSVVLLKMKFNWNWVNGTTCRHDWIRPHRPRTLESQREYLIECAERVEDAKSYTVHFCKSQYDRNHHCLAVSLSLTLDEAMTVHAVLSTQEIAASHSKFSADTLRIIKIHFIDNRGKRKAKSPIAIHSINQSSTLRGLNGEIVQSCSARNSECDEGA